MHHPGHEHHRPQIHQPGHCQGRRFLPVLVCSEIMHATKQVQGQHQGGSSLSIVSSLTSCMHACMVLLCTQGVPTDAGKLSGDKGISLCQVVPIIMPMTAQIAVLHVAVQLPLNSEKHRPGLRQVDSLIAHILTVQMIGSSHNHSGVPCVANTPCLNKVS